MNNINPTNITIPYIFLHLQDKLVTQETMNFINQAYEIHFFHDFNESLSFPFFINPNVYIYCFNKAQIEESIKLGYTPHICLRGNDLFTSSLYKEYKNTDYEFFWFPDVDNISFELINETASMLNSFGIPICISFSPIFNLETVHESSRLWLKQLYQQFKNPLVLKEKELLDHESFQNDNLYVKQSQLSMMQEHMILGIHGDMSFIDLKTYLLSNVKTIKKTADCIDCLHSESCINRGLGYILKTFNYQGCIGIKLLE